MKQALLDKIRKVIHYYRENGIKRFVLHVFAKLFCVEEMSYKRWRKKTKISKKVLEEQTQSVFDQMPLFSIVIPLYCTPANYLIEMMDSVLAQSYRKWELCLSDGSGFGRLDDGLIREYMRKDKRIKFVSSREPLSISNNTNQALSIATGDYIVFMDHDDLIEPNALYECVKVINTHPHVEIIYTDEDKVSADGKKYFQPHFKSDFNIDLLRSMNYICHLFVVSSEVQRKVGLLRQEFDGAQDYDFILRCVEVSDRICHIPQILYHWRTHQDSTSENPESKLYAFEAGRKAIEDHLKRVDIPAEVKMGEYLGIYRVNYFLQSMPLASILIPNKDHTRDLARCINSLFKNQNYGNFEVIIIENNSETEEVFHYYEKIQKKYKNIKVIKRQSNGTFNFSALNNFAAKYAHGQYLLFLNNDTEILNPESIKEMVSLCMREEVGAVGAKLYYPDGTIQHAGVILGLGGVAGHAFKDFPHNANGYFSRIICRQDYSAVTAACMMVPKTLFEEVGGFDERLEVAFNDIDLCLKIRDKKKLVVYTPYAELCHYESKSRGQEDTQEKVERFNKEVQYFRVKWEEYLTVGDIYYNPNLTLEKHDFSLKVI